MNAKHKGVKAGRAFLDPDRLNDPRAWAVRQLVLRGMLGTLGQYGDAIDDVWKLIRDDELESVFSEMRQAIAQGIQASAEWRAEWERTYGEKYPDTIDQWKELSVFAGRDAALVESLEWKPGDALPIIQGWLRRLKVGTVPEEQPAKMLTSWREITDALGEEPEERGKIKRLNEKLGGPIPPVPKGSQPIVKRFELIEWWNGLASMQQEMQNRSDGKRLTAEATHDYGRDGIAAPEIDGEQKKRRRDKKT